MRRAAATIIMIMTITATIRRVLLLAEDVVVVLGGVVPDEGVAVDVGVVTVELPLGEVVAVVLLFGAVVVVEFVEVEFAGIVLLEVVELAFIAFVEFVLLLVMAPDWFCEVIGPIAPAKGNSICANTRITAILYSIFIFLVFMFTTCINR